MLKRCLMAFGLLLLTVPLWAQVSKTFNWTNPSQYVNGTSLPPASIRETRISVSPTAGGTASFVEVAPGSVSTYVSLPIFPAGDWFARAQTVDIAGQVSDFSNTANFTVGTCQASPAGCAPLPPTGLSVQ